MGECDGRVENAARNFLEAGVEADPAQNNAHNHAEGVTAAGDFVLASQVQHNEEHGSQALGQEHLAVGGQASGLVDDVREEGISVGHVHAPARVFEAGHSYAQHVRNPEAAEGADELNQDD